MVISSTAQLYSYQQWLTEASQMFYLIDSDLSPFTSYTSEIHYYRHMRWRKCAASRWLRPLTLMTPGRKVVRNKYTTFCRLPGYLDVGWTFILAKLNSKPLSVKLSCRRLLCSIVQVPHLGPCSCGASEVAKGHERVEKRLHLIMKSIQTMCLWPLYTQSKFVKPVSKYRCTNSSFSMIT